MNNVTPINQQELLQEQACLWISCIDRGITVAEKAELQAWLVHSEQHKNVLYEMASLWDDLSVMHELSDLFPLADKQTPSKGLFTRSYVGKLMLSTAASVALMTVMLLSWLQNSDTATQTEVVKSLTETYTTEVGQQRVVSLQDNSQAILNTDSAIEVAYQDGIRAIQVLRGEVHFDVAADPLRPFVVSAGDSKVVAIGTAFNTQLLSSNRLELLVTEGKVLVSERSQPMPEDIHTLKSDDFSAIGKLMVSGDGAIFKGDVTESVVQLNAAQLQRSMSWHQGMLVFEGEALEAALAEMARYTDTQFQFEDDSLKRLRVAGYFKVGDTAGLLRTLQSNFGIQYVEKDRVIYLKSEKSKT